MRQIGKSRKWIRWGIPVFGVALLGALWWVWIPAWALEGVRDALQERVGMTCTLRDLDLGLSNLEMNDVRFLSPGGGLDARVGTIRVEAPLFELIRRGASAVRKVTLEQPHLEVAAGALGTARSITGLRERFRGSGAVSPSEVASAQPEPRTFELRSGSLSIRDSAGSVVELRGVDVSWRGNRASLSLEAGEVDSGLRERLEVISGAAELLRGDAGQWTAASVELGSLRLVTTSSASETNALGVESFGASSLVSRLREVRTALLGVSVDTGSVERAGPWTSRLASGFRFRLASGAVAKLEAEGESELMTMSGGMRLVEAGLLAVEASGSAGSGAAMSVDIQIRPEASQIVGDLSFQRFPLLPLTTFLPALPWYRPEDTRVTGEITINEAANQRFSVGGRIQTEGLGVASTRIAATPVRDLDFELRGAGTWEPAERRLVLREATWSRGSLQVELSGTAAWPPEEYSLDLRAAVPRVSCQGLIDAIPQDLTGEFHGFQLAGTWSARASLRVNERALSDTDLDIDVNDGCEFRRVPPRADLRRVEGAFRHRVTEPDGSVFAMTTGPATPAWQSRGGLSPFFVAALITREDGAFRSHGGFSVSSIQEALVRNLREGRFVYGASTITMQLAKNLFLSRDKTLARKTQEVLLAWMLEHQLSKEEIIELYANIVEFGRGVYGIRHASRRYFGRTPAGLSPAEATFLASVLPNPKVQHAQLFRGELTGVMRARIGRVLRRMADRGRLEPAALAAGLAELEEFQFHSGETREPWAQEPIPLDGEEPLSGATESAPTPGGPAPLSQEEQWRQEEVQLGGSPTQW